MRGLIESTSLALPGKLAVGGVLSKAPAPVAAVLGSSVVNNPLTRNYGGTLLSGTMQATADTVHGSNVGEVKDAGQFATRFGVGVVGALAMDAIPHAGGKILENIKFKKGLFGAEASLKPAFASVHNGGGLFDPPATGASHSAIDPSKPMLSVTGNPGSDAALSAKGSAHAAEGSAQSAAESATAARGSGDTAANHAQQTAADVQVTGDNAQTALSAATQARETLDLVNATRNQIEQQISRSQDHILADILAAEPAPVNNAKVAELKTLRDEAQPTGEAAKLHEDPKEASAEMLKRHEAVDRYNDAVRATKPEDLPHELIAAYEAKARATQQLIQDVKVKNAAGVEVGIKDLPEQRLIGDDGVEIARVEQRINPYAVRRDPSTGKPMVDNRGKLLLGEMQDTLVVNISKLGDVTKDATGKIIPLDAHYPTDLYNGIGSLFTTSKSIRVSGTSQWPAFPPTIHMENANLAVRDSLYRGYDPDVKAHDFSKNRTFEYTDDSGRQVTLKVTDTDVERFMNKEWPKYRGADKQQAFNDALKDMPLHYKKMVDGWNNYGGWADSNGLDTFETAISLGDGEKGGGKSVSTLGFIWGSRSATIAQVRAERWNTGTDTIFSPNSKKAIEVARRQTEDASTVRYPGTSDVRDFVRTVNSSSALGLQRYTAGIQTIQVAGTIGTVAGVGIATGNLLNNLKLGERSQTMVDPNDLSLIKAEAAMNLEKAKLSGPLGWVSHIPVLNGALAGVGVPFVTTPDNVKALENNLKVLKEVSAKSGYNYLYELQQIQKQQNELTSKERVAQNYNGKNVPMSFDEKRPFAERVASLLKAGDVGDYGIEYINQLKKLIGDEIAVYDKMMVSSQINRAAFGLGLFGDSPLGAQLLGALQTNLDQREKELFVGDPLKLLEYNLGVVDPNDKNPTKAKKSAIDHTLNVLRANFNDTNGGLEYYQDLLKKQSKEDLQRLIVSIVATSPGSSKPTASLQFMRNELGTQPIPNQYFTYENAIKASKDAATRNIGEWLSRQLALEATRGGQIASREDAAMGRAATLAGADHAAEVNREQGQANRDLSALTASNTQKLNAATAANSLQGTYRTGVTNWLARAFPNNRNASDIMINFQDQPLPIGDPTTGKLIYQPGAIRPVPLRIGHGAAYNDTVLTQIYNAARQTGYSGDYGQFKQQVVEQVRVDRTKNNSGPVSQDEIKKPLPPMLQSDLPIPTANPAPAGATGSDPMLMQTNP
jgi:hypothetical protein